MTALCISLYAPACGDDTPQARSDTGPLESSERELRCQEIAQSFEQEVASGAGLDEAQRCSLDADCIRMDATMRCGVGQVVSCGLAIARTHQDDARMWVDAKSAACTPPSPNLGCSSAPKCRNVEPACVAQRCTLTPKSSGSTAIPSNASCEAISGVAETRLASDDLLAGLRDCETDADCEHLAPTISCVSPMIRVPSCGSAIATSAHDAAEARVRAIEQQFCQDASKVLQCLVGASCPTLKPACNEAGQCELRMQGAT